MSRVIVSTLAVIGSFAIALSTTIHVPNEQPTIQAGLNIAIEGDTVQVAPGTYYENIIWPSVNGIKLIGSGQDECIIDGDSLGSVIRFEEELGGIIDTLTAINGFTIQNGMATYEQPYQFGGGIYCFEATPSLENLIVTNNTASHGSGIACENSSPVLRNLMICDNNAYGGGGGGVYCINSNPILNNVEISNNSGPQYGGVYCQNSSPILTLVNIHDNGAFCSGGISCVDNSNPILNDVEISSNSGMECGGVYCHNSSPILTSVNIHDNNGGFYSGGFTCVEGSNPILTDVLLIGNSGSHSGGGIHCSSSSLTLSNATISGNTASFEGGGIYCSSSSLTLTDVMISDNSVTDAGGGGVFCSSSSLNLTDVTISDNSAVWGDGGGIYCSSSNLTLTDATISGNLTHYRNSSGGGFFCDDSNPTLTSVVINGNSASYGGGFFCEESNPTLTHVTISGNSASYGGGIYCEESSLGFALDTLNRCSIYSNNVQNRGSGADIYTYNCDTIEVIVDTFTVMIPTEYHVSPLDNFTFDILNAVNTQIDADLYVSPSGDNSNDGLTPQTPLKTIQHAASIIMADSENPHTIHLADGVYSPSTNGEYFPVEVRSYVSLTGGSEDGVVLDAESTAGVMRCGNITSSTISNLTLTGGFVLNHGGGIFCYNSSPSLMNVTVNGNSAGYSGGGIYCGDNSNPAMTHVTVSGNSTRYGGGICCDESYPILTDVTISGNSASYFGGGIFCDESNPNLANMTISDNSAQQWGGGIFCATDSSPNLTQVTITGNSAYQGGGFCCGYSSSSYVVNCILWNNTPQEVYFVSVHPSSITISCCDVEGGEAGIETNDNGTVYWHANNIDADPLFCDPGNGDYRLQLDSPCRTDVCGFMGYTGETCDGEGVEDLVTAPSRFYMADAYPNPFNPSTTIEYSLPIPSEVTISVYNINGQLVDVIHESFTAAGQYTATWSPRDLSSGVYLVELRAGAFRDVMKVSYVK